MSLPSSSQGPGRESLAMESPGSPDLLDPASPSVDAYQISWQDEYPESSSPPPRAPGAESDAGSAVQAAAVHEDSDDSASTFVLDAGAARPPTGEDSNDSTSTFVLDAGAARPPAGEDSNDSASTFELVARAARPPEDEESSSSALMHEARVRRSGDHSEEPPAKLRKLSSKSNDDMDGETCPICLDSWGNTGEHRLVALRCGHLFGAQCVERWLRAQPAKERSCPTCKTKSTMKDIRHIYARKLVAADTSQITSLQKQVDTLQTEKSRVELELQKSRIAHRACVMQLEVLRSTLMKSQVSREPPPRKTWRFALEKNLEICKDGGCRVLTYNCRTYELYVSQKSTNSLFAGYGIRKVNCVDYKLGSFVHLHPKPIRDITYSQPRDLLLSVALDGTARVVERGVPSATVHAGVPLWSCSWDYLRGNEFYVGGVGGLVHRYDVRSPRSALQRLQAPGDVSPVVSLRSTEFGLLSCQLNSCWLWAGGEPRALPVEGPFMSLAYDEESRRVLVATRPGAGGGERARLALCRLRAPGGGGDVVVESEQTFGGSARAALLSRAAWVRAGGCAWLAAHSESEAALVLHGLAGARSLSLPAAEPALDVAAPQLAGDTLLAALSDSRLRLYKAVATGA